MRADRLVSALMLLQTRGRVTASEVAAELEVSERTARRDLEALSLAGVPLYSQQGRGGGWSLVGGARTDLSGLNAREARALFLVAGPRSDAAPELQAALRKLVAALPETFQSGAVAASEAVMIDPAEWGRPAAVNPVHLDTLQVGVVERRRVWLGYRSYSSGSTQRPVEPLGLVAKGTRWYLVATTLDGYRVFRLDRVTGAELTDERFERPEGFDLAEAWRAIATGIESYRSRVVANALVDAEWMGMVRMVIGERLTDYGPTDDGPHAVTIGGQSAPEVAAMLAGFGAAVVVHDPPEVIAELARMGTELVATYPTTVGRPVQV